MSGIRFTIVTDDPVVALLDLFGLRPSQRPSWLVVTDDPAVIDALPDGAKCCGQWYSRRDRTIAEKAWRDRRGRGGIAGIDEDDEARIFDWIRRKYRAAHLTQPAVPLTRPEPVLQNMPLSQRWT